MTVTENTPRAAAKLDSKPDVGARRFTRATLVIAIVSLLIAVAIIFAGSFKLAVGLLVIALMIGLMLLRIPAGLTMIVASILGLAVLVNPKAVGVTLGEVVFASSASWSLSVIPMFVLMGITLGASGLTSAAYETAQKWMGRLPGGLAMASNLAGAGLAASSGSTIGITYAIGRVAIPEMLRAKYTPPLALGTVAMSGTLGQIIPPSILLVIYAGIVEVPIGQQLLAGVVPGVILAGLFMIVIFLWAWLRPGAAPRSPHRYSWAVRLRSLTGLLPVAVLVAAVIGGIYSGWFTATEAGAVGAIIAGVMGLGAVMLRGRGNGVATQVRSYLSRSLLETTSSVASIFFLLIGVLLLTRVIALSGLSQAIANFVIDLGLTQLTFLLLLIPIYLVLGFFLDTLAMMLLTIPVFLAPLTALDIDLIWFGVFLVVLAELDLVAPPFGVLNFVVHAIARSSTKGMGIKISIVDVFKGVMPFIGVTILLLVALVYWPEIATWLPFVSSAR